MAKSIIVRLCLSITLASLVSACGNVRFTSGSGSSTNASQAGAGSGNNGSNDGNTTTGNGGNNGGNDGNLVITPGSVPPSGDRQVNYQGMVPPASNQVDILLVVDNSSSMSVAQGKLAAQMGGFATALSKLNVDWQMCMTVTTYSTIGGTCAPTTVVPNADNPGASLTFTSTCVGGVCTGNCTGGTQYWGTSYPWQGYTPPAGANQYILKPGTANMAGIFQNTITAVGDTDMNTGDERGLKAAYNHFANAQAGIANAGGCYRPGSSVAVILLSNEDERSVGGTFSLLDSRDVGQQNFYSQAANGFAALDNQESPAAILSQAENIFGQGTNFTWNSIVVGDANCQSEQDQPVNNVISFAYVGNTYLKASALTNGGTGSICSSDFSNTMNLFAQQLGKVNTLANFTLQCTPESGTLVVTVDGNVSSSYTQNGAMLTFSPALVSGQSLDITYHCSQ